MIGKYRKKPVVVEAVLWLGFNWQDIFDFFGINPHDHQRKEPDGFYFKDYAGSQGEHMQGAMDLYIETLEGTMKADIGDYIIKGVMGEFCPCKPEGFKKTYERID
jgi:hypothetical protein